MNPSIRALNATSTGGKLTYEAPDADFARLDHFPEALRRRIADNNTKFAARAFEDHIGWATRTGRGPAATIAKVAEIERNELAVFAGEYRAQYGHDLPHLAAGASIQRYGALGPSRHPPRRFPAGLERRRRR